MPDLAVSNDTEIIAKVPKTVEILMIFKVHTYGEQTVDLVEGAHISLRLDVLLIIHRCMLHSTKTVNQH